MSRDWASDERTPDPERSVSMASCFIDFTTPSSSEVAADVAAVVVLLPAREDLEETDSPLAAALAAYVGRFEVNHTFIGTSRRGVGAFEEREDEGKGGKRAAYLLCEPLSLGCGYGSHCRVCGWICQAREATENDGQSLVRSFSISPSTSSSAFINSSQPHPINLYTPPTYSQPLIAQPGVPPSLPRPPLANRSPSFSRQRHLDRP
jgi:hypothetical protein